MNTNTVNPEVRLHTDPSFGAGSRRTGLRRPVQDSVVAGVAAGLARYLGVDVMIIRLAFVVLTIVGGKVVYAASEFSSMAPPELPVSPNWSPVKTYRGYAQSEEPSTVGTTSSYAMTPHENNSSAHNTHPWVLGDEGLWSLGCDCFAF